MKREKRAHATMNFCVIDCHMHTVGIEVVLLTTTLPVKNDKQSPAISRKIYHILANKHTERKEKRNNRDEKSNIKMQPEYGVYLSRH